MTLSANTTTWLGTAILAAFLTLSPHTAIANETLVFSVLATSADESESINDAEQDVASGEVDLTSSDLELVEDRNPDDEPSSQVVGIRYEGVSIPRGTRILEAYIEFSIDEFDAPDDSNINKNIDPFEVTIRGEASDDAAAFSDQPFDISNRAPTAGLAVWSAPPRWEGPEHLAGSGQRTPDLSAVVQEIVNRSGWEAGNAMVFTLEGFGKRVAESYEGSYRFFQVNDLAPKLFVVVPSTESYPVSSGNDDAEEEPDGDIDLGSSDLEITIDSSREGPQTLGIRFGGVTIPKGATVLNAAIQFTVDPGDEDKNRDPFEVTIFGEAVGNAPGYTGTDFEITDRLAASSTSTSVNWSAVPAWESDGAFASGANQRTPDLAAIVQEIVDRDDWDEGNGMAFTITGTGTRTAGSYNNDPAIAPVLTVTYIGERQRSSIDKLRLSWTRDPATTMDILWDQRSGNDPTVYYDLIDPANGCPGDPNAYAMSVGPTRVTSYQEMNTHLVELSGLAPGSAYAFVIEDSNGTTECSWFRTAPNVPEAFTYITGGDTKSSGSALTAGRWSNEMVSKLRPLFILFTGDFNSGNGTNPGSWIQWLTDWSELTVSADGRRYPIIAVHGNHEDGDFEVLYNLFNSGNDDPAQPNNYSYYSLNFAGNLLHVVNLNSQLYLDNIGGTAADGQRSVAHRKQVAWLDSDLAAHADFQFKIAGYHKPIAPHTQSKSENPWLLEVARIFETYGLDVAHESDTHNHKHTFPLVASQDPAAQEGLVRDDVNGVLYTGEGSWGASPRANNDDKVYTIDSAAINQFKWNHIYPAANGEAGRIEIYTVVTAERVNGDLINRVEPVASVSDADPFTPPDGITIREIPFYGQFIELPFEAVSGEAPLAPVDLVGEATSFTSISLSWTNIDNPLNVRNLAVERAPGVGGDFVSIESSLDPDTTTFSEGNLNDGTEYVYRIRAMNVFGDNVSDEVVIRTPEDTRLRAEFQEGVDGYAGNVMLAIASASPDRAFVAQSLSFDQRTGDYGGNGVALGLLRFDNVIGPAGVPDAAVILEASLRFRTTSSTNGPVALHRMLEAWDLATVSWNLFGGNGVQADDVEALAAPEDALSNISSGEFQSWDVTDAFKAWSAGAPNNGLLILNRSGDGWDANTHLYSGASERRPRLTVFYAIRGDANGDGELTRNDMLALRDQIRGGSVEQCPACDMNSDGVINTVDLRLLSLAIRTR